MLQVRDTCLNEIEYWCGNPAVKLINGIIRYHSTLLDATPHSKIESPNPQDASKNYGNEFNTFIKRDYSASRMGLQPSTLTSGVVLVAQSIPRFIPPWEFAKFLQPLTKNIKHVKVLHGPLANSYLILIYVYPCPYTATSILRHFNGKRYNKIDEDCVCMGIVKDVRISITNNSVTLKNQTNCNFNFCRKNISNDDNRSSQFAATSYSHWSNFQFTFREASRKKQGLTNHSIRRSNSSVDVSMNTEDESYPHAGQTSLYDDHSPSPKSHAMLLKRTLFGAEYKTADSSNSQILKIKSDKQFVHPIFLCGVFDIPTNCCVVCLEFLSTPTIGEFISLPTSDNKMILDLLDPPTSERLPGIVLLCGHNFHLQCMMNCKEAICPVCRYEQYPSEYSCCDICGDTRNILLCLTCGFIGCSSSTFSIPTHNTNNDICNHAEDHYCETQHNFAMEIEGNRVRDFARSAYVHRLVQNCSDGKMVEVMNVEQKKNAQNDSSESYRNMAPHGSRNSDNHNSDNHNSDNHNSDNHNSQCIDLHFKIGSDNDIPTRPFDPPPIYDVHYIDDYHSLLPALLDSQTLYFNDLRETIKSDTAKLFESTLRNEIHVAMRVEDNHAALMIMRFNLEKISNEVKEKEREIDELSKRKSVLRKMQETINADFLKRNTISEDRKKQFELEERQKKDLIADLKRQIADLKFHLAASKRSNIQSKESFLVGSSLRTQKRRR